MRLAPLFFLVLVLATAQLRGGDNPAALPVPRNDPVLQATLNFISGMLFSARPLFSLSFLFFFFSSFFSFPFPRRSQPFQPSEPGHRQHGALLDGDV